MGIINFLNQKSQKAFESTEEYLKATENYIKLKIFEQLSLTIGFLVKLIIIVAFAFIGFSFLSVALAMALGELFNSMLLGCLAVGFFFLLITLVVFSLRKKIDNKVISSLSNHFFSSDEKEA